MLVEVKSTGRGGAPPCRDSLFQYFQKCREKDAEIVIKKNRGLLNVSKAKICKTELLTRHSLSGLHGSELGLLLLTFKVCWKAYPFPGAWGGRHGYLVQFVVVHSCFGSCWLEWLDEAIQDAQGQTYYSEQTEEG